MTYEQFALDFWHHLKRMAVEPSLSMGELVGLLAYLAFKPPWWIATPLVLVWLIWRHRRDSGSRPAGENSRSEVECEARQSGAESASPKGGHHG